MDIRTSSRLHLAVVVYVVFVVVTTVGQVNCISLLVASKQKNHRDYRMEEGGGGGGRALLKKFRF